MGTTPERLVSCRECEIRFRWIEASLAKDATQEEMARDAGWLCPPCVGEPYFGPANSGTAVILRRDAYRDRTRSERSTKRGR